MSDSDGEPGLTLQLLNHDLAARIVAAEELLTEAKQLLGDTHSSDCETVQSWLDECKIELDNPIRVSIALLGSTGAGKSTLINALIGAQILPTSSLAVCTSSITRVRYRRDNGYTAEIEIVPLDSWERQLELAVADIRSSADGDSAEASYVNTSPIPDDEAKRIRAIYGGPAFDEFVQSGDRSALVEPEVIRKAFEERLIKIQCDTSEELRQEVSRFLTSKDVYWPIVRTCIIEGPFENLDHGAELVDLPGLNDPNEAREELTRNFLETARFVWVVFNMKRSLGRDLTQVLESRDLLNRLLAGGRLSSLTFVGTHSDDVSSSSPEDFSLNEDASAAEMALARSKMATEELRTNLQGVARALSTGGLESPASVELNEQLVKSPVFMVSASNHLQMSGITKSKVSVIFEDPTQTSIPALSQHLRSLSIEAGPRAGAYAIIASIEWAVAELASLASTLKTQQLLQSEENSKARESLLQAVETSAQVLRGETSESRNLLGRSLQEAVSRFKTGASLDKAVVHRITSAKIANWSRLHWATMRATSSRGGRFSSPTFGEIDFIKDLSSPVIAKAMDPWKEFFEQDLVSLTKQVIDALHAAAEGFGSRLTATSAEDTQLKATLAEVLPDLLADLTESVEASLTLARNQISEETLRRQQELHTVTEKEISKAMLDVFARASSERGHGMKVRMIATLESGSQIAVVNAIEQVQVKLAELAELAMEAILSGVDPVMQRIDEKMERIIEMLTKRSLTSDTSSIEQLDRFLTHAAGVRHIITQPILMDFDLDQRPDSRESGTEDEIAAPRDSREFDEHLQLVILDASNIARSPGLPPDIAKLDACRRAAEEFFLDKAVVLIADASLPRLVENQSTPNDQQLLNQMVSSNRVVIVPPGVRGKADGYILENASKSGGIVVSNDSYKEFQSQYPWLFDDGRLFGHTFHPVLGWQFTPRFPVRPRSY